MIGTVILGMNLASYLFNLGKHHLAALASFAQIINTHSRHMEIKANPLHHWTQLRIYAVTLVQDYRNATT